jgi:hypothetical protein
MASSVERDELMYDGGEGKLDGPFAETMTLDDWLEEQTAQLANFYGYYSAKWGDDDRRDAAGWDEVYCEWLETYE